ncbi:MAG TPA: UdgX family uracil-DNA binding protein [Hyphomicrobiaceae bacterium]|nr:UdgX family uracil-DNA binding protein [Hyphomicrobiaceae bacterium]
MTRREPNRGRLVVSAGATAMAKADTALQEIAAEAAGCRRCPLYRVGTQTVFGQGPASAPLVFVGEQPGDREDLAGLPFVGPAGRILDAGLAASGIDRTRVYVTNAVKHFKNVPRGKRRIHQRPNTYEIDRCRWWLDRELAIIKPRFTVALGATAAAALAGKTLTLAKVRGRPIAFREGVDGFVTVHPSYILRLRDQKKEDEYAHFIADLKALAKLVPEVRVRTNAAGRARRSA